MASTPNRPQETDPTTSESRRQDVAFQLHRGEAKLDADTVQGSIRGLRKILSELSEKRIETHQAPVKPPVAPEIAATPDIVSKGPADITKIEGGLSALSALSQEHQRPENRDSGWFQEGNPAAGLQPGRGRYIECRKHLSRVLTACARKQYWKNARTAAGISFSAEIQMATAEVTTTILENGDFPGGHDAIRRLIQNVTDLLQRMLETIRTNRDAEAPQTAGPAPEPAAPATDSTRIQADRKTLQRYRRSLEDSIETFRESAEKNPFWTLLAGMTIPPEILHIRGELEQFCAHFPEHEIDTAVLTAQMESLQSLHDRMRDILDANTDRPAMYTVDLPEESTDQTQEMRTENADNAAPTDRPSQPLESPERRNETERTVSRRVQFLQRIWGSRLRNWVLAGVAGTAALVGISKMANYDPSVDDADFDPPASKAPEVPATNPPASQPANPPQNTSSSTPSPAPANAPAVPQETVISSAFGVSVLAQGENMVLKLPNSLSQIRYGVPGQPVRRQLMHTGGTVTVPLPENAKGETHIAIAVDVVDPATNNWVTGDFVKIPLK